jgi:hypothetical protein
MRGAEVERSIAVALSGGRIAIGLTALVAPGAIGRTWIGPAASDRAVKVILRALGARDLALAAGTMLALRHDRGVRGWLEAAVLADTIDALATLAAGSHIPPRGRWGTIALAGSAAVVGAYVARRIGDGEGSFDPDADQDPVWVPHEPGHA